MADFIKFEEGKTYQTDKYTAFIIKRTPKFINLKIGKTDDYGWTSEVFKRKISTITNFVDDTVETVFFENFLDTGKELTFYSDAPANDPVEDEKPHIDEFLTPADALIDTENDVIEDTVSAEISNEENPTAELAENIAKLKNNIANNHKYIEYNYYVPDCLTAINLIEEHVPPFVIDSQVKIVGGIFAKNELGFEMFIFDDRIEVKAEISEEYSVTKFWFDIPESKFIAELKEVTAEAISNLEDVKIFSIVTDNGDTYTYSERSLEIINAVFTPDHEESTSDDSSITQIVIESSSDIVGNVKDFIIHRRRHDQYHLLRGIIHGIKRSA